MFANSCILFAIMSCAHLASLHFALLRKKSCAMPSMCFCAKYSIAPPATSAPLNTTPNTVTEPAPAVATVTTTLTTTPPTIIATFSRFSIFLTAAASGTSHNCVSLFHVGRLQSGHIFAVDSANKSHCFLSANLHSVPLKTPPLTMQFIDCKAPFSRFSEKSSS